jgi:fumarylacetoacetate (FAA) hydrolase
VRLVRKARNSPVPETITQIPLMYQGASDSFLAPTDPLNLIEDAHGLDLEAEVGVILGRTPCGTKAKKARDYVRLVVLINDVSLRGLIPDELARGFGFLQGKPPSAFAPVAITPDELHDAWKDSRVHLPLNSEINGELFGNPDASQMHFGFDELIEFACYTRDLAAGTILGSGTVSNEGGNVGYSCIVEKRMEEIIASGTAKTPFLKEGDQVRIWMEQAGKSIFGEINQTVKKFICR